MVALAFHPLKTEEVPRGFHFAHKNIQKLPPASTKHIQTSQTHLLILGGNTLAASCAQMSTSVVRSSCWSSPLFRFPLKQFFIHIISGEAHCFQLWLWPVAPTCHLSKHLASKGLSQLARSRPGLDLNPANWHKALLNVPSLHPE